MGVTPDADMAVSKIAAMIGEPTRARILMSLLDGSTRSGVELAAIAGISPSTASVHLSRLEAAHLIDVRRDGKCRYYGLNGFDVARVLQDLSAMAVAPARHPAKPARGDLRAGRRCYDHMAGEVGITLYDGFAALGWLVVDRAGRLGDVKLTAKGILGFAALGLDIGSLRGQRRRFAYGCVDWQEGKRHVGGALGAALTRLALGRQWVVGGRASRELHLTKLGRRELLGPIASRGSLGP